MLEEKEMQLLTGTSNSFEDNDAALFFYEGKILVEKNSDQFIFSIKNIVTKLTISHHFFLEEMDERKIFAVHVEADIDDELLHFFETKIFLTTVSTEETQLICRAMQLLNWHHATFFCGYCGSETKRDQKDTAKICLQCSRIVYPYAYSAIIVLVHRNHEILLARSSHFPTEMYSTLAGFIYPGESCEAAIHREIFEEVGIKVKNISYFGSQPWPFPNSFMIGFFAEYESGKITIQADEIEDAQWFTQTNLPKLPSSASIARQLIESFFKC